jgi:uncharacterized protein (TIGR02231 family)
MARFMTPLSVHADFLLNFVSMKSTLSIAAFLALATMAAAQTPVKTDITAVTVYLNGAVETRSGAVSLKKGENQIVLASLSQFITPGSVQVKGSPNFTISSVKYQINYLTKPKDSPTIKQKRDSLENTEFLLSTRQAMKSVYAEEKSMILSNKSINGNQKALMVEDLEEMAGFFRNRLKEIEFKLIETERDIKKFQETVQRLKNELNQLRSKHHQNTGEIHITLLSDKNVDSPLEVSYLVNNAGWYPTYDLRSADLGESVELVYKAKVWQATGNEWNNVTMTFSTGNPALGGQHPSLYPWFVGLREPGAQVYRATANSGAPAVYEDREEVRTISASQVQIKSKSESFSDKYVQVKENVVQTEFIVTASQTIPSDNQQYDIEVQRVMLKGAYEYFAVPKLDKDAFLIVHVMDWMKHNLLPGESNIYFKGSYVGSGYLDPMVNSDSLTFSMGRDRGIVIKREPIENLSGGGTLGSKRRVQQGYEISITNTKKKAIRIKVEDQVPVKTDSQIEVEHNDLSGGQLNTTTGTVTWTLDIPPGETVKRKLIYTVKYPKKKVLTNF